MFRIIPSSSSSGKTPATLHGGDVSVGDESTYGVHDTMREGIRSVRSEVIQGHPLENHLSQVTNETNKRNKNE